MNRPRFKISAIAAGWVLAGIWFTAQADPTAPPVKPAEVKPVIDGPEGQRAFDELAKCYSTNYWPDDKQTLADLKSHDAPTAQKAGKYILALLEQSFADESNGRAGWIATPFANEGPGNRAHDFCQGTAKDFGISGGGQAALPAAVWLIENDTFADEAEAGAHVLARVKSEEADKALEQIISEVHPNQEVLVTAIKEAGARHLAAGKDGVIALEQSYRKAVREAAVHAAAQLGETHPAPFDPLKAFSPRVVSMLKATLDRINGFVPPDAQWLDGLQKPKWTTANPIPIHGWQLSKGDKGSTYLDVFGRVQIADQDAVHFTPGSLAATAKRFAELRARFVEDDTEINTLVTSPEFQKVNVPNRSAELAKLNRLTQDAMGAFKEMAIGPFSPGPGNLRPNLPELTVSAWCWQRGDLASAASVLFPCYDGARDDRWLDWITRDDLGNIYHLELIDKFTNERDYPASIALATHLAKPAFDGYVYQARARELAAQLATRSEDFTTLTLPKAAEWQNMKSKLDRNQQIVWLATRLKLMHCINPGFNQVQHPIPFPGENLPWPEVINPYTELVQLNLTPADLLILAPYAADEDYSPSYTFYKDFIPERGLCRVSWAVGALINQVAGYSLTHQTESGIAFDHGTESSVIEDVKTWVAAHHDDTPDKLLTETLSTSNDWNALKEAAIKALQLHHVDLLGVLADRLDTISKNPREAQYREGDFVHLFYDSHAPMVDHARQWVKSPCDDVRFWASLILVRDGDAAHDEGFDTLEPLLSDKDASMAIDRYTHAAPTLLASPSPRARKVAAGVFQKINPDINTGDDLQLNVMYRQYLSAGRRECLDFLLKALDDYTIDPNTTNNSGTPSYVTESTIFFLGTWGRGLMESPRTEADIRKYRAKLKDWLTTQFTKIEQGKPSELKVPNGPGEYERYLQPAPSRPETAEAAAGSQD